MNGRTTQPTREQLTRRLGKVGVWCPQLSALPAKEAQRCTRAIESLHYRVIWVPEGPGRKEALSHAGLLLAGTSNIVVATGIANIWARDATAMANGARTLGEAYPSRFVLGLGVSHAPFVMERGQRYYAPVETMARYIASMGSAKFDGVEPREAVPLILAALGPRMLRLARDRAAGAHPYFVPVEHTQYARAILGPRRFLAVEIAAILDVERTEAMALARSYTGRYLGLENYRRNLNRLGWRGADVEGEGSTRLVEALVVVGDAESVKRRIEEHLVAGADHVCVRLLTQSPDVLLSWLDRIAVAFAGDGGSQQH